MSTAALKAISLEPEAFVQGGLISDVDVEVTEIQFCGWDYDGAVSEDILAVKASLTLLDENGKPDPTAVVEQYWSAGGAFHLVGVSDDGYQLLPSATKTALTRGSNLEILVASLRQHGMPKGYLEDGNLGRLKGVRMHVNRQTVKREGLGNTNRRGDREATTLVCTKIHSGPWDKQQAKAAPARAAAVAGAKVNGAAQAAPAQTPAQAPDAEVAAQAVTSVQKALAAVEGGMFASVKDLKVAVFRMHAKDKAEVRNQIVKLVEDVAWLEANGIGVVDGAVIGQM